MSLEVDRIYDENIGVSFTHSVIAQITNRKTEVGTMIVTTFIVSPCVVGRLLACVTLLCMSCLAASAKDGSLWYTDIATLPRSRQSVDAGAEICGGDDGYHASSIYDLSSLPGKGTAL